MALTREQILDAAEDVLRRDGPAKTNVVDVARALNVSHGSVYRHFPSKAALREAVAERFLQKSSAPLDELMERPGEPAEKLRRWLETLFATKRRKALEDPELFATYVALAHESVDAVQNHVDHLIGHLTEIVGDPQQARAIFDATARFHDPRHAADWADPTIDDQFEAVWALLAQAMTRPASSAHSSAAR
jgi:AcrR family transcriptional regulator